MYGTSMERFFWTQKQDIGASPRTDHSICYDSHKEKVLLFGGLAANTSRLGDTWMWNGNEWTQVADTGPSARHAHTMTYDESAQIVLLFSGATLTGGSVGETWGWDGNEWTHLQDLGPGRLVGSPIVYTVHGTILFGGKMINDEVNDNTWLWDGQFWTHVQDMGPSARFDHAMAYDSRRDRIVLFGGGGVAAGIPYLGDTWELKIEPMS